MMRASVLKRRPGAFNIFHPSDFSQASDVAFAHALKIALQSKAKLDIMHVAANFTPVRPYWTEYPAVRSTLARWGILPEGVRPEEVAKAGVLIRKFLTASADPLESMMRHFRRFRPDLIVLASHQRQGLDRWMHKAIAEPLARRSGSMTLFVPREGHGFIDPADGSVHLKRVLIPVDHDPDPQIAIDKAFLLARGLDCPPGEFRLLHVGLADSMPPVDLPRTGWSYENNVAQGNVVDEILKAEKEWEPNLMVLVTQGRLDFLDALRGSTTERVLRGAQCPILAVPARTTAAR
jgi:nucleotide-binding universal stress UspA family protein